MPEIPLARLAPALTHTRPAREDNPRLVPTAHQFEASLLQELLKPMQSKGALFCESGDESEGSSDALSGFGSEALAQAISEHGGIGIARQILGKLSE